MFVHIRHQKGRIAIAMPVCRLLDVLPCILTQSPPARLFPFVLSAFHQRAPLARARGPKAELPNRRDRYRLEETQRQSVANGFDAVAGWDNAAPENPGFSYACAMVTQKAGTGPSNFAQIPKN
jgi:hypothetical protein